LIWAVSLSTEDLCTQGLTSARRIRRFSGRGGNLTSLAQPKSDSTPAFVWWGPLPVLSQVRCSTDIDFVENQLSPGSISFSLLATAHPVLFQQQWVRPGRSGPSDRWFPGGAVHLTEWVPRVSQRLSRTPRGPGFRRFFEPMTPPPSGVPRPPPLKLPTPSGENPAEGLRSVMGSGGDGPGRCQRGSPEQCAWPWLDRPASGLRH